MTVSDEHAVLVAGPAIDEREARLATGADGLASQRASIAAHPRFLMAVAGALMTTGLTAIVLAWLGAARSTLIEEQVPYLISGGLLGVALAVVGALTFFVHWLTVLIREARAHEAARAQDHDEMMEALRSLRSALAPQEDGNGTARSAGSERSIRRASSRS
jgi:hypothetical protein